MNVRVSSCKAPFFCRILKNLGFSLKIGWISSNTKFHENPSSGIRVVPCGRTRQDMAKVKAVFFFFFAILWRCPVTQWLDSSPSVDIKFKFYVISFEFLHGFFKAFGNNTYHLTKLSKIMHLARWVFSFMILKLTIFLLIRR